MREIAIATHVKLCPVHSSIDTLDKRLHSRVGFLIEKDEYRFGLRDPDLARQVFWMYVASLAEMSDGIEANSATMTRVKTNSKSVTPL